MEILNGNEVPEFMRRKPRSVTKSASPEVDKLQVVLASPSGPSPSETLSPSPSPSEEWYAMPYPSRAGE